MVVGAVYRPEGVMEPAPDGEIDHVAASSAALATVAFNCADWPAFIAMVAGLTLTVAEGISVIVADEYAVGFA